MSDLAGKSAAVTWRDVLAIHPAANLFPLLSDQELAELGADIKAHGLQQRVVILASAEGDMLLDGRNRLDAMERIGVPFNIGDPKLVREVWNVDPFEYVIGANIRRRHLTSEQKRELIAKLLKLDAGKSDRQIANTVGVHNETVAAVRKKLVANGDVTESVTRTDSKGRHQPASKTKTAAVKSAKTKSKRGQPEQQIDLVEAIAAADGETAAAARKAAYAIEEQQAPPPDAAAPDEDDSEAAAVEQHRQELVCQRAEFLPMLRILIDVAQYMDPSDMVAAISDETEEITPFGLGDLAGWCTQVGAELVARKKHSKEAVATGSAELLAGDDPGPVPEFLRRGGVS